jgi:hypothetical protein
MSDIFPTFFTEALAADESNDFEQAPQSSNDTSLNFSSFSPQQLPTDQGGNLFVQACSSDALQCSKSHSIPSPPMLADSMLFHLSPGVVNGQLITTYDVFRDHRTHGMVTGDHEPLEFIPQQPTDQDGNIFLQAFNSDTLALQCSESHSIPSPPMSADSMWKCHLLPGAVIATYDVFRHHQAHGMVTGDHEPFPTMHSFQHNQLEKASTKTHNASMKRKFVTKAPGDGKRCKILRRNRIASFNYRRNKKAWISELESRGRQLQASKDQYAMVVTSLREEVMYLRSEMLRHVGCSCVQIREYIRQSKAQI